MAERRYKAICFDMGDTLIRVDPSYEGLYHRIFQRNGHDIPLGEVKTAVESAWDRVMRQDRDYNIAPTREATMAWQRRLEVAVMTLLGIDPQHHDDLFMQIVAAFDDPDTYVFFTDTLPTLQRARKEGYKLAVISNWGWGLPDLCTALGLDRYFDVISTSARVGASKPNPAIFEQTLRLLDVAPHEALHIGDMVYADIEGAWNVGMSALWLERPERAGNDDYSAALRRSERAEVARITIRSLNDIWPFLETGAPTPTAS